jgi:CheY-like chemotaxis protein
MARVLVVDDEVGIRHVVRLALERVDISVLEAADPQAALAVLSQSQPDLVIADVHLPGMDGVKLARRMRMIRPTLPVIFMSASIYPHQAAHTAQVGIYLEKPFKLQKLQNLVQETLLHPEHACPDAGQSAAVNPPRRSD